MDDTSQLDKPLTVVLGHDEIVIRRRYETASIANDFLIALWFLVGSVMFLYPSWEQDGVWLFILGSVQFLIRPTIRLASHIHLKRIPSSQWEG
ncbi:MAG: YrhK family protein [Gammaproteobacteria bacterium]|nr:YrhK family protein [Gammaproteobacteria bacterium]